MTADTPTVVATSGGLLRGPRGVEAAPLLRHAVELSGAAGRPVVCSVGTATGDDPARCHATGEALRRAGWDARHLLLFPMPNVADVREHVLSSDVVWVGGGSVAGLLVMWRLHGLDAVMREAWEAGVVLAGVSAGSICWHVGGTTDSFGPDLRPVTDGLALLPHSNGVHHDSEEQRRPAFRRWVADGTLPDGYCTDDGTGLVYRGTELVEAVGERRGAGVWSVRREGDDAVEERVEVRLLPRASG